MQPSPDDQPNPTDRPGTPPRPPYSPVTPVLSHLAPVPNNNHNNGTDFPASSAPFSASPSHPIVPPPARSPSPTTRIAPPSIPALQSNVNSHSQFQNHNLNHTDISISTPFSAPPPPPLTSTTPSQTSPPQQQQQQQQGQQSQLPRPTFLPEPSPIPISESENPDAIALRSAISILQMQKQQSMRDLRTLERLKKAAAADPEAFARELAAGNLSARRDVGGFLGLDPMSREADDDDGDDEGDVDVGGGREEGGPRAKFETIPTPQNVVRMPPVNWAKYQIVGDPLDRMHEDQRRRPFSGEPRREDTQRAPEHVLASPYRPLVDKLETPSKVKGANKSKKT
ncbi:uncharacterized protein LDX57_007372 [Aspergillus melleus]|uniref:uncharacterized protein n=1 Tax=Aspergillus melleus TaxID=138277 RepID=UPI001E8CA42D|nr:uncharacterized protein LDX57_007372 [Aspergillus melleus]KAH8429700.1 hypothetical protein LDX57_007372 [Aspergillus melleus]